MGKPKMPYDTDAFLADTTHLSTAQVGAYHLLLMAMWRSESGWLPGDDGYLSRAARLTLDKWRKMAPTIRALLKTSGNRVSQARLLRDRQALSPEAGIPGGDSGLAPKPLTRNEPAAAPPPPAESGSSFALTPESSGKDRKKKTRGEVLPDSWAPQDAELLYAKTVLKVEQAEVFAAAERMRRWAIANQHRETARKAGIHGWNLTFRNWLDREVRDGVIGPPKPRGGGRDGFAALAVQKRDDDNDEE